MYLKWQVEEVVVDRLATAGAATVALPRDVPPVVDTVVVSDLLTSADRPAGDAVPNAVDLFNVGVGVAGVIGIPLWLLNVHDALVGEPVAMW